MAVQTLPDLWWVIVLMVILIGLIMALVMSQMGPRFGKFQIGPKELKMSTAR